MRAPAGTTRKVLGWTVVDQVMPLPYTIGSSQLDDEAWIIQKGLTLLMLVGDNNYLGKDNAAMTNSLPRMTPDGVLTNDVQFSWRYGSIVWQVPIGWGEEEDDPNFGELVDSLATGETQEMVIFSDGKFGVRKFRHMVTREVDGTVYLDGRQVR